MSAARESVVDAAIEWARALEREHHARFHVERVPMATFDDSMAAAAAHKTTVAAAFAAEVILLAAVRAAQKEVP